MFCRKSPKFSNTRNICCSNYEMEIKSFCREICSRGADEMADSRGPDQTASLSSKEQSDLGLHCLC